MSAAALVSSFDTLLMDLDGVLYVGPDPVAHAGVSLTACRAQYDTNILFVTNNASRTPDAVAAQLVGLGVAAEASEVVTSAQVAAAHLATELPAGSRVLVIGGGGLIDALEGEGLVPVSRFADDPAAVVQGFHPDTTWQMLAEGAAALHAGVPWIATNKDMTFPSAMGIAPGNGALIVAVEIATGREPVVVGKPYEPIMKEAMRRAGGLSPLVVGDRLDTDIASATRVHFPSLLVLTGVSTHLDLCHATPSLRPTFIGADLRVLLRPPRSAEVSGTVSICGDWIVSFGADGIQVVASDSGQQIDGLRALVAASWALRDAGTPATAAELSVAAELFSATVKQARAEY